jgi:serine/threonine protein kinase
MGYMAPEQFQNAKRVGPQADVYAIGVVVFRCVAGRLPFVSRSFETLIKMKVEQPSPLLSSMPGIGRNERLDAFVQTALAAHPSSRFDSGHEMLEAWWRVAADLERESPVLEAVEVVFEFEDDIEVSTDVGTKFGIGETMAEVETTTVSRHIPRHLGAHGHAIDRTESSRLVDRDEDDRDDTGTSGS